MIISLKTIWIFPKKRVMPNTRTIFMILEPITFPMTKPLSPCLTEDNDAANSGKDVPNATMDIPITKSEIPK